MSNPYSSPPQNQGVLQYDQQGAQQGQVFSEGIPQPLANSPSSNPKSRAFVAWIALFVGEFGIVDFYLGYKKSGMWKLGFMLAGLVFVGIMSIFGLISVPYIMSGDEPTVILILQWSSVAVALIFFIVAAIMKWISLICILARKGKYRTDVDGTPLV